MGMKLSIQKWGNSAAVRLPAAMLAQLGVSIGDEFEVEVAAGAATLRVAKPEYKLADLLAGITPENRHDEVDFGAPVAPRGNLVGPN